MPPHLYNHCASLYFLEQSPFKSPALDNMNTTPGFTAISQNQEIVYVFARFGLKI